jgi:hypothetical protein
MKPVSIIEAFHPIDDIDSRMISGRVGLPIDAFDLERFEKALSHRSSHPGELPPEVLTEPYVKLSLHTALVIQP